MAERINTKIEKEAHKLSANAEFHASDVADEYQKGVKVAFKDSPALLLANCSEQWNALPYPESCPTRVSRCPFSRAGHECEMLRSFKIVVRILCWAPNQQLISCKGKG